MDYTSRSKSLDPNRIRELTLPDRAARVLSDYSSHDEIVRPFVALVYGSHRTGKTTTLRLLSEIARHQNALPVFLSTRELGTRANLGPVLAGAALSALEREYPDESEMRRPLESAAGGAIRGVSPLVRLLRKALADRSSPPTRVLLLVDDVEFLESVSSYDLDDLVSGFVGRRARAEPGYDLIDLVMASESDVPRLPKRIRRYELRLSEQELARRWDELGIEELGDRWRAVPRDEFTEVVEAFLRTETRPDVALGVLAATWKRFGSGDLFEAVLQASLTKEEQQVLSLITLLQPVERSYLAPLLDTPTDVLDSLDGKGLLVSTRGGKLAALEPIGSTLVARSLADSSIELNELAFGSPEAETDRQLDDVLVQNRQAALVLKGERSIIVGDRGAGKSAVYKQLRSLRGSAGLEWRVVGDAEPGNFVQRMTVDAAPAGSADHFRAVWLAYCAAMVAIDLLESVDAHSETRALRWTAYRLLRTVGWAHRVSGDVTWPIRAYEAARSFVRIGLKLSIGPVTLEPSSAATRRQLGRDELDIDDFLQQADGVLRSASRRVWAAADRIDELYKYDRPKQEPLVQGVLLAETRVAQLSNIRLAPFLRTDLYELYDLQEKNKSRQRRIQLSWKEDQLRQLLLRRAYGNVNLRNLAAAFGIDPHGPPIHQEVALAVLFPRFVEDQPFFVWLIETLQNARSRVAPRQIVLFLNDLVDSVESEYVARLPVFTTTEVVAAVRQVSRMSFEEVVSDFRVAVGFVESCRAGRLRTFSIDQVGDLFDLSEGSPVEQINRLERLGVVGRGVAIEDDQATVRFEIPRLYWEHWEDLSS